VTSEKSIIGIFQKDKNGIWVAIVIRKAGYRQATQKPLVVYLQLCYHRNGKRFFLQKVERSNYSRTR
jgi:hypothetical protein